MIGNSVSIMKASSINDLDMSFALMMDSSIYCDTVKWAAQCPATVAARSLSPTASTDVIFIGSGLKTIAVYIPSGWTFAYWIKWTPPKCCFFFVFFFLLTKIKIQKTKKLCLCCCYSRADYARAMLRRAKERKERGQHFLLTILWKVEPNYTLDVTTSGNIFDRSAILDQQFFFENYATLK